MYDIYETTDTVEEAASAERDDVLTAGTAAQYGTRQWDPAEAAYASDHLFAVLDDGQKASDAAAALHSQGFASDDVRAYSGQLHARLIEQRERERVLTRFFRAVQEAFTYDEHTSRRRYTQALRQGKAVVLVYCLTDEQVQRAADVLAQHGAEQMAYYGRWTIQLVGATQTVTTGEPRLPRPMR